MLEVLHRPVRARCASCNSEALDGTGSRHVFLLYSERAAAHLAITLRMKREDDGRVKVLRQVWLVPDNGSATELESADDDRLDAFWRDSRIRCRASEQDPEDAVDGLEDLAHDDAFASDPLLLREIGNALIDAGRTARALGAYELSLRANPKQPDTLRKAGRLFLSFGRPQRAAELLRSAWDATDDPLLLRDIVRAAYRGRQLGVLEQAAHALIEEDSESVLGHKALAAASAPTDIGAMRDAWEDLRRVAARSGERATEGVAKFWCETLALPFPDWTPDDDVATYRELLADELVDAGYERVEPQSLEWNGAEIPVDLDMMSPHGERLVVTLFDQRPNPVLAQRIAAAVRAARAEERRPVHRLVPLSRQGLEYAASTWVSGTATAALLIEADADTTMRVLDENIAAFVVAAETHFGRPLTFDLDSLKEVDAILLRLHDDGFGSIPYAFQCQVAAYVGQVLSQHLEGAEWAEGEDEMDPRVYRLPSGEELNLITKVRKVVRNGAEDSIAHFVNVVLQHVDIP